MLAPMTTPIPRTPTFAGTKQVATRLLLGAGGVLLLGLLLGCVPSGSCGSPWFPSAESFSAKLDSSLGVGTGGNFDADCQQSLGSRGNLGSVLVGLAGLFWLGSVLVWNQERMAWAAREKTAEAAGEPVS